MNSIRNKLLLAIVLVTIPPLLSIGWYGGRLVEDAMRAHGLSAIETRGAELTANLEAKLSSAEGDLLLLSNAPTISQYLLARDSKDVRLIDAAGGNLTQAFARLSEIRGDYHQIRFIDSDGKERIRVAREGTDSFTVSPAALANEVANPFFREALKAPRGTVLVSALGLARNKGKIEEPQQAEIRFAAPVFNNRAQRRGVVTIHVNASALLAVVSEAATSGTDWWFLNEDGSYASHPEAGKLWGGTGDLATEESLVRDFPALAPRVLAATEIMRDEDAQRFVLANRVIVPGAAERTLGFLVAKIPTAELYATASDFRRFFNVLTFEALAAVLIFGSLVAHWITRPIVDLTAAAERMSRGDLEAPIEATSTDEIKTLAEAMERLRKSMKIVLDKYA
ncbi:MAG: HAMP domain-containing protein [Hyphomicrobiaceae bacterium]|jgi:HAMP domain-containing protein